MLAAILSAQVQYNDYRITTNTNSVVGMVRLTTSTALAVLGYLPSHDIFNTAVFTNRAVSVPITSMVVNSWAATNASIVTAATLDACALMQASNSVSLEHGPYFTAQCVPNWCVFIYI